MITGENIQDALSLLPEELIAPVDALRRKKRIPWKPLTALAACLCLCVGLWYFSPGGITAENAAGSIEDGLLDKGSEPDSGQSAEVTVYEIAQDCITVIPKPAECFGTDITCIQVAAVRVTFENLDIVPAFSVGQRIRIYYHTEYSENDRTISPYRIEIIED